MRKIVFWVFTIFLFFSVNNTLWAVKSTQAEMIKLKGWVDENLGLNASTLPFSFIFNGRYSIHLMKSWEKEFHTQKLDENRTRQTFSFIDPEHGLAVRVETIVFCDFPAVEWVVYLKNTGNADTPILENILPLDYTISLSETSPILHYSKGALCCLDDFAPVEQKLDPESSIHLQPGGGRSSSEITPFFNIDLGGNGVVLAIGWTGEWAATFRRDNENNLLMQAGMALTHLKLHPGEEIRTPSVLMLFWQGLPKEAVERRRFRGNNLLRRFILAHHRPQPDGKPLTLPITFPTWGGTAASEHISNIRKVIDYNLPVGLYWIDAEWFGKSKWRPQVGNWQYKKELYPQGFKPISNLLHESGRQFLLWFEPFRVAKGTLWYQFKENENWLLELKNGTECFQQWRTGTRWPVPHEDPKWIYYESHRNQITQDEMLFNLGNAEARRFLINFLSQKFEEFGLDWFRDDANISPLEYWREADAADRQGMTEIRYVEGLYAFWDELLRRYPHLKIDNCASGGRRIDLETIGRSTALHRTDWARSAIHAQCHSYGLFQWLPLHMAGRGAILEKGNEYELRSVMTAGLAVSLWDQKKGDLSRDAITLLDQYLDVQKFYYGDYYPLTPYSQENNAWIAWQFDLPETGEGMIQAFRRDQSVDGATRFRLRGLEPGGFYVVTDIDTNSQIEISGRELLETGLLVTITGRPGSALIKYCHKN